LPLPFYCRFESSQSTAEKIPIPEAKRDIKTRQHLMERSFAQAKRFGFDRARWRGLWRMKIPPQADLAITQQQPGPRLVARISVRNLGPEFNRPSLFI
jgi:hypothetical protein